MPRFSNYSGSSLDFTVLTYKDSLEKQLWEFKLEQRNELDNKILWK